MTRVSSLQLCLAVLAGVLFLPSCDSGEAKPKPGGTGIDTSQPPPQKAIYLRARHDRPPGTMFRNTATLTMEDADIIITQEGGESLAGKSNMLMREIWDVIQVTPNERTFTIEEMSIGYDSVIGGRGGKERSASTLVSIPFKVTRADDSAPWMLSKPEKALASLQETEMRMLGKLWAESSELIYPKEPLDIGETWKADPKAFGMIVSPRLEIQEGEVTCRLEEITVLRAERCASISVDVDITGVIRMSGSDGIQVQIALTGNIMRALQKNYDMRTELKGSMQMEMSFPEPNRTISVDGVAEFLQLANMKPPGAE